MYASSVSEILWSHHLQWFSAAPHHSKRLTLHRTHEQCWQPWAVTTVVTWIQNMGGAQVSNGDLLEFRRYLTCKLWSDLELCWFIWSRFGMLMNSCGNNTMIGSFDGYLEAAADMKRTSMNLQIWYWQQLAFVWYSFWNVGKQKINARIRMFFMVPSYAIRGVTHTATHLSKQKKNILWSAPICSNFARKEGWYHNKFPKFPRAFLTQPSSKRSKCFVLQGTRRSPISAMERVERSLRSDSHRSWAMM